MPKKIRVGIKEGRFQLAKEILKKDNQELNPKFNREWVFIKVSWEEYSNLKAEIRGEIYINED